MHSLLPKLSLYTSISGSCNAAFLKYARAYSALGLALLISACASGGSNYERANVESRDIIVADDRRTECVGRGCADAGDVASRLPEHSAALERARYFEDQAVLRNDMNTQVNSTLNAAEYYIQAEQADQAVALIQDLQRSVSFTNLTPVQRDRIDIVYAYNAYANADYSGALRILERLMPSEPVVEFVDPRTLPEYQERELRISQLESSAINAGVDSLDRDPRNPESMEAEWDRQVIDQPRAVETLELSPQQVDALLLGSFCYQALGQYDQQIAALIKREQGVMGEARAQSVRYTWQVINALPPLVREQIIAQSPIGTIKPRIEQSLATSSGGQVAQLKPFTNLPQAERPAANAQRQSVEWTNNSVRQIAVLLPISSRFGKAATAVLDGIKHEHELRRSAYSPELLVYDVGDSAYNTPQYYQAAVNQGAEFVIGPLGKDFADELLLARSQYTMRNAPALVLGGSAPLDPQTIRLEFSPEREGVIIARKANADGHLSAALITANDTKSQRIKAAFVKEWLSLGGRITAQTDYSAAQFDHTVELKLLFRVGASEIRAQRLNDVLGYKPEHAAYQRGDIDFILMTANSATGRLLRPQINFFTANRIPVYAGLDVYGGVADAINDMDLEDTRFPVMPWVLRSEEVSQYGGQLNQLFALGADAYRIASQYNQSSQRLELTSNQAIEGYTGLLSLQNDGNIESEPLWASFKEGLATVQESKGFDLTPLAPPIQEDEHENGFRNGEGEGTSFERNENRDEQTNLLPRSSESEEPPSLQRSF